jgi:predicted NBD/HSP70 family sugar kinase
MEQLAQQSDHDDKAAALLEDILSELALWTVNVAVVVDPERVVIGGGSLGPVQPGPPSVRPSCGVLSPGRTGAFRSRFRLGGRWRPGLAS